MTMRRTFVALITTLRSRHSKERNSGNSDNTVTLTEFLWKRDKPPPLFFFVRTRFLGFCTNEQPRGQTDLASWSLAASVKQVSVTASRSGYDAASRRVILAQEEKLRRSLAFTKTSLASVSLSSFKIITKVSKSSVVGRHESGGRHQAQSQKF